MNRRARWETPALVSITLLAAALRLPWLAAESFWSDEIGTLLTAAKPLWKTVGAIILTDMNPPLFYTLVHFWLWLGHSEWIARLLPALCGVAAIPLLWLFVRRWFGVWPAVFASAMLAMWPAHVYYSGELRYQTLTTLLAVLSCSSFAALITEETPRNKELYWCATIAGLYTNYLFLFLLVAQAVAVWPEKGIRRLAWRRLGIALLAFLPGLLILGWQAVHRNWAVKLLAAEPTRRGFDLLSWWTFGGVPWRATTLWPWLDRIHDVALGRYEIIFAALALPIVVCFARGGLIARRSATGRVVLAWAFVPTAILLAGSLFAPIFEVKLLLPTLPAVAVVFSLGAVSSRPRPSVLGVAILLYFLVLSGFALRQQLTDPRYFRDDWRTLAKQLAGDLREGDVMLNATFELRYYSPRPLPEEQLVVGDPREFVKRGCVQPRETTEAQLRAVLPRYRRVWFYPNVIRGIQLVDDAENLLRANLYDATPPSYRGRPRLLLLVKDRADLAAELAPYLPTTIDFEHRHGDESALRGWWLPTDEGWRWTTVAASAWLRREGDARRVRARIYVNTDLFPQHMVRVTLQVEGATVDVQSITRSNQIMLSGTLPDVALSRPAVEVRIVTDKIIYQDMNDRVPHDLARTVLVGELSLGR